MAEPDFELMTPEEVSSYARSSFFAAEQAAVRATEITQAEGGALHEIALALSSIAYGLKITTPEAPTK